ncbi:myb-like protein AA [Oppia nitens]|uniref:myb-like protein AA n=1 Tax=Oppia nitens TaxID=1686743 RepID=UPI0023DA82A0|nr:myb-like protein AA [Oppia nitens]
MILVPASIANLYVHFRTKSSQIHVKQEHRPSHTAGHTQHSVSQDEPHYLKHEIKKPVIQTVREVIVPYRQVIQQIKPVIEEVKTVVAATGEPKSSVYMSYGNSIQHDDRHQQQQHHQQQQQESPNDNYVNSVYNLNSVAADDLNTDHHNNYGYYITANHLQQPSSPQAPTYTSYTPTAAAIDYQNNNNNYHYYSVDANNDNNTNTNQYNKIYDLSTIYGAKPTNYDIHSYYMTVNHAPAADKQPPQVVYETPDHSRQQQQQQPPTAPIIYGIAEPLDHTYGGGYSTASAAAADAQPDKQQQQHQQYYRTTSQGTDYGSALNYDDNNDQKSLINSYNSNPTIGQQHQHQQPYQQHNAIQDLYYKQNYQQLIDDQYYEHPNKVVKSNNNNNNDNYYTANNNGMYDNSPVYDSGDAAYLTLDLVNGYTGDLATSDGYDGLVRQSQASAAAVGAPAATLIPIYSNSQYNSDDPMISKASTLGSLAQLFSATIPSYHNQHYHHHYPSSSAQQSY